jgi:hypothetical protein
LQQGVHRYANALMAQVSQTAACNRFHVIGARLARWLLMTRDRVGSGEFRLTHEFLAHMLGVRRVGVTQAARSLQARKLIEYNRGNIRILDDKGPRGSRLRVLHGRQRQGQLTQVLASPSPGALPISSGRRGFSSVETPNYRI